MLYVDSSTLLILRKNACFIINSLQDNVLKFIETLTNIVSK